MALPPDVFAATSCLGKEAYATQAKAIIVLGRRRKRARRNSTHKEQRRDVARLSVYHCTVCHHWHIGGHSHLKGVR